MFNHVTSEIPHRKQKKHEKKGYDKIQGGSSANNTYLNLFVIDQIDKISEKSSDTHIIQIKFLKQYIMIHLVESLSEINEYTHYKIYFVQTRHYIIGCICSFFQKNLTCMVMSAAFSNIQPFNSIVTVSKGLTQQLYPILNISHST